MRKLRSGIITAVITIAASALLSICAWAGSYDYPNKMLGSEGAGPGAIGWMQNADSSWSYAGGSGALTNSWAHIDGYWYYFGADGHMVTGWGNVGGTYYFFTQDTSNGRPLGACVLADGFDPIVETIGNGPGESSVTANTALPYGGSYVDVNITAQTVTVYVGGIPVLGTPCVTGNAGTHDTTRGVFTIKSRETARYLQGTNDDGSKYKSFVNFWMPFNGGEGLHDASWRSSFGGTIYQYGGSHGCVNLPYDAAAAIYNLSFVGMTVVVHE